MSNSYVGETSQEEIMVNLDLRISSDQNMNETKVETKDFNKKQHQTLLTLVKYGRFLH